MTFEEWWREHGGNVIRKTGIGVFDVAHAAALEGWNAHSKAVQGSPFETWLELHGSECKEFRYNEKCFELCWNSAIAAADELIAELARGKDVPLRKIGGGVSVVSLDQLKVNKS
jgi:hypothetical protein